MKITKSRAAILIFILALGFLGVVKAEEYTTENFIIRDPVLIEGGGNSTSTSFELLDIIGQISREESTSTSFIHRAGFLSFPITTIPSPTATAGDRQVVLTWTASTGILANITNYEVGTATTSGGPYTFESVGNVLSFTKTGLTSGTTYYFRVRSLAGTLILAKSDEVSATPSGAASTPTQVLTGTGAGYPVSPVSKAKIARILKLGDFNGDGRIDIADFSILLFYFEKPVSIASRYDFNSDGQIDIVDVSILLYYWTG